MMGLVLGIVSMIGGISLLLSGVAGSTSWTTKILGNQSTITDAAPGAVLFVVGLFGVIVTRYKVKMNREEGRHALTLALLCGEKRAVAPEGTAQVGPRTLWILLLIAFLMAIPLTATLFNHIKPSQTLGMFTLFIYLRLFAYFGLGLIGLLWYARALNELKRECLTAENVRF